MPILKRKRATLRSNITRFVTAINDATEGTTPDDLERYRNSLQETLDHITSLDYSIHGSLNDVEYAIDVESFEVYIDSAKHAIYKAKRDIDTRLSASMSTMRLDTTTLPHTPIAPKSNSQPLICNPFRTTLSRGSVFGSRFCRPWTQTLPCHRLTIVSF